MNTNLETSPLLPQRGTSESYESEVGFRQPINGRQRLLQVRCPSAQGLEFDSDAATLLPPQYRRPQGEAGAARFPRKQGHCHDQAVAREVDKRARRKLILACIICLFFMVGEIVGGILAHSLAIISDAAHLLTDIASFMISLLSLYLTNHPSTLRFSYGLKRAEILGALISILLLWVLTGVLAYEAVQRVIYRNFEINATVMLITAGVGVAVNLILALTLHQSHGHTHGMGHGHSHDSESRRLNNSADGLSSHDYGSLNSDSQENLSQDSEKKKNFNVTASFVHVLGDLLQSLGVLASAFIIYFKPEWKLADPICTFIFAIIVVSTTVSILKDIVVVLMEGAPRDVDVAVVRKAFYSIEGVKNVHNLRIWSLSTTEPALSVHIAVETGTDAHKILKAAGYLINFQFGIKETTMQVEEYVDEMSDCTSCQHLNDQ